ncbi:uncharacterized protein LOC143853356 isoform X1 [Tasmannia lanceolata]|uniref:uncharacterized protein LOC143853356 isoform X1 n=1 Tax=Tasmannia lanceolata TaxID=3420 RepID=UPI0040630364
MFQSILLPLKPPVLIPGISRRIPAFHRRKTEPSIALALRICNQKQVPESHGSNSILLGQSLVPSPTTHLAKSLGFRPSPELGLVSLLFVISAAVGAFFSLAIISLPAMNALRRLAVSMDKLSKVVSEEVPGTLSSLKLSGLEINDLTDQLSNLRQRTSGIQYGIKERGKPRSSGGRGDPIMN